MLGGENVRELLCVRVYFGQQFLKGSGGIMRVGEVVSGQVFVRFCVLLHDMRGGRFTKVCSEAAICLNIEKVVPHCRCRGGEVSGLCGSGGGAMTFGISPHRLGRILPGGVEMKRRNWCGVGAEETIRCQSPRVGTPCAGDINQKEGIGLWPAESRVCQSIRDSLRVARGQRMEFNSVAITTAGFRVDAVAFERLEHTIRTKVSSILRRNEGRRCGRTFRPCSGLDGRCETYSVLFDCAAAIGCWRTIRGVLKAAAFSPGLKVEDEESFQDVLGHRTEAAVGQDTKFVGGDHVLSSGIKVAWHITAVVALEGLQAHPAKGRFRNVRACEKSGSQKIILWSLFCTAAVLDPGNSPHRVCRAKVFFFASGVRA